MPIHNNVLDGSNGGSRATGRQASFAEFLLISSSVPEYALERPNHGRYKLCRTRLDASNRCVDVATAAGGVAARCQAISGMSPLGLPVHGRAWPSSFLSGPYTARDKFVTPLTLFHAHAEDASRQHAEGEGGKLAVGGHEHDESGEHHVDRGEGPEPTYIILGITVADVALGTGFLFASAVVGAFVFGAFGGRKKMEHRVPQAGDTTLVPSLELAQAMPTEMYELSNEELLVLSHMGSNDACVERLVREVMRVDHLEWSVARRRVIEIDKFYSTLMTSATFPYMLGIGAAILAGGLAIPFVYCREIAEWTNDTFVHSPAEEPENMKTIWEVSGWSWNWMEPLLGTASFTILCLQLVRAMGSDVDMLAFNERCKVYNADLLADKYPEYNRGIIRAFAKTSNMHRESLLDDD